MANLRLTVYWNPDLVTHFQGKINFGHFNANGEGTYKITLKGINFSGNLLRKTSAYTEKIN